MAFAGAAPLQSTVEGHGMKLSSLAQSLGHTLGNGRAYHVKGVEAISAHVASYDSL